MAKEKKSDFITIKLNPKQTLKVWDLQKAYKLKFRGTKISYNGIVDKLLNKATLEDLE